MWTTSEYVPLSTKILLKGVIVTSTMDVFRALPLPAPDAEADSSKRLLQVITEFSARYGRQPTGVARAPGRVNLIGEHVDYEGYAVLPMAIEQSVYVAFSTVAKKDKSGGGVKTLSVANAKPQYKAVTLSLEAKEQDNMQKLEQEGATWAKYVLCGVLGFKTRILSCLMVKREISRCWWMEISLLVAASPAPVRSSWRPRWPRTVP